MSTQTLLGLTRTEPRAPRAFARTAAPSRAAFRSRRRGQAARLWLAAAALVLTAPAFAQTAGGGGGAGASISTPLPGGSGGNGFTGAFGNPGTSATLGGNFTNDGAGGGGGGAAGGGSGGGGGSAITANGGTGGSTGTAGSLGHNASADDGGGGGGGGGGGTNGFNGAAIAGGALIGGDGGAGGIGGSSSGPNNSAGGGGGGGGGGGAGGYGAIVTSATINTNTSTIIGGLGGTGGAGGDGSGTLNGGNGGSGGTGGIGIIFTSAGATLNNSGTIQGGNGGTAGSGGLAGGGGGNSNGLQGNAGLGGAGVVGTNLTIIDSGAISGGLAGDGTTRANAITFTGGANVLQLQAGYTMTGNVVGTGSDTFQLGGNGNSSFNISQFGPSAQYQGFSTFVKLGSSAWTLTGNNAAALPWSIDAGTLNVTGTMANSAMTVNNGGVLAGAGGVGSVKVNSGSTFAPGNSGAPGTGMTVSGNLAFASGGVYLVQLSPSASTSATVSGTATVTGATVDALFMPGSYIPKRYDVLNAGNISGTFAALNNINLPVGFTVSLSYTGSDVFLNLTAVLAPTTGLTGNERNVATTIDNYFNRGGTLPPAFAGLFSLTGGNLANALMHLDGEVATGTEVPAFQLMTEFLNLMLDPFVDGRLGPGAGYGSGPAIGFAPDAQTILPPDVALAYAGALKAPPAPVFQQRWTAWGASYGGANTTAGDPVTGSSNLTAQTFGFAAGMDYHYSPDTIVGFALGGGGTAWGLAGGMGTGRGDAFQSGVYGITRAGPAYLGASLAIADHWMTTSRATMGDILNANFNAQSYGGRVEAGYRFAALPTLGVTPYAAVQAQAFHTPSYSETDVTGGGLGLSYGAQSATDTRTELGARFDDPALVGGIPVLLRGRLAWAHDFVSNPALSAAFETLPGSNFIVNGAAIPHDSALTTAGAEIFFTPRWSLLVKFDGDFAPTSQTYAGSGTLRYRW